jgi:hypothetical protein
MFLPLKEEKRVMSPPLKKRKKRKTFPSILCG